MNLYFSMLKRPSFLVIFLAYIFLFTLVPCWYVNVTRLEHHVNLNSENVLSQFHSEIKHLSMLIKPMSSSSTNLARLMNSTLRNSDLSFSDIETKVAPVLFQAFKTVPHLSQISYIGIKGLFFSFYTYDDKVMALYSNSTSSNWGASKAIQYYSQHVNHDNGELYGDATIFESSINASWVGEILNSSKGYASLGTKWNNDHDLLFFSSAKITAREVISLGFGAKPITDFFSNIGQQGAILYLATKDGQVLVEGVKHTRMVFSNDDMVSLQSMNGDQINYEGSVSCKDGVVASNLRIQGVDYLMHCSSIDIMGIESVYVVAVPSYGGVKFPFKCKRIDLILLITMLVTMAIVTISLLFTNAEISRASRRQKEATEQAEQKNMNKSIAFDTASHDIRNLLTGLSGLIDMSYQHVVPSSELETNLKQMDSGTKELLGILDSILDISKIEAGKMELEEEEFDVFQLLEDVVDWYHPKALKKGLDIVLDSCNGSILRYSHSKGDRVKLKRILCNLLNNAIKFTDAGHIVIRAWTQKPTLQNSMVASNQSCNFKTHWSCLFSRKNEALGDIESTSKNSTRTDSGQMSFTFEVDDTGKGIPKDKHESVFENYVQVKENALGHGGTGLGLGIVKSLVHLMHGNIGIVDKDVGEKGTCFRFSVLLTVCETISGDSGSGDRNQSQGPIIHTTSSGSSMCSSSPRLTICSPSPTRPEAHSRVVLLVQDEERRRTTQRFMESLGIKVKVVKQWTQLSSTLNNIRGHSSNSNSLRSPGSSSHSWNAKFKCVPLSSMDGNEYVNSIFKKTRAEANTLGFVLIVVDVKEGQFGELCSVVYEFKRDLGFPCRVVWLDNPLRPNVNENACDSDDIVMRKPFHGSRLFQVVRLLPEYGECSSSRGQRESGSRVSPSDEQEKYGGSLRSKSRTSSSVGESSNEKPLSGKRILVVEDNEIVRRITTAKLERLGASVEKCENGQQAVQLVQEGLTRYNPNPPYDYILMDCEMPVMDGFEATERIREMEKKHFVRIPIIALTAYTVEEAKRTVEAGMDHHLDKSFEAEHLLKAITNIQRSR